MAGEIDLTTCVLDRTGREIQRGDVVKVFHFIGARGKRNYMYKQCLGPGSYGEGGHQYMFFSHLNFIDNPRDRDGPYHEHLGTRLDRYEIVQSIEADFRDRTRHKVPN